MNYRLLSLIMFVFCGWMLAHSQERGDTVKVIDNASNVTVVKRGNTTEVNADYIGSGGQSGRYYYEITVTKRDTVTESMEFFDDWGMDFPFVKTQCVECEDRRSGKHRVYRALTGLRHIYWGWRFNYNDKGNMKNSFEVGVRDVIGVSWKRRGAEFEIGVGFGLKRFLADEGFSYVKEGDAIMLAPVPEGIGIRQSRLDVWSFQIPVFYNQNITKGLSFTIGGVLNLNSYAKSYTKSDEGTMERNVVFKGLQQNLVTVEALAAVRLFGIGIYGSWSPMKMFDKGYGPEVKSWSLGIDMSF